jgi:flavin-dependent thymidylate synthase
MTNIRKWADEAMFVAAPMQANQSFDGNIIPTVTLLSMTPDPLGAVAAACRMYEGKPTYDMADITDEERVHYWNQANATHLKAPLEFIDLHFFVEGVTRSFTHQMVRQRTAVYAQESLRFAVKENIADEVSLPPSIAVLEEDDPRRVVWKKTVEQIDVAYNGLVASGVPAEDARGLLPHATTTRLHYKTNLRNLAEHAGNRLCTQAQFEWRIVFMGIVRAIRDYGISDQNDDVWQMGNAEAWQYQTIAESKIFRPVCYAAGRCPFQASFDRGCTIRARADAGQFDQIQQWEWMADPAAARVTSGGAGHD